MGERNINFKLQILQIDSRNCSPHPEAVNTQMLETLILQMLPGSSVAIADPRGDGLHYIVHVQSAAFEGMSRLDQHRMIYAALHEFAEEELERLSLKTSIP